MVKEHFSEQLEDLRRNLILMGGEVERQIQRSIEALTEVDEKKAADVIAERVRSPHAAPSTPHPAPEPGTQHRST